MLLLSISIVGVMNADISDKTSLFANHIVQFCHSKIFGFSCKVLLPVDTSFTYLSEAWKYHIMLYRLLLLMPLWSV